MVNMIGVRRVVIGAAGMAFQLDGGMRDPEAFGQHGPHRIALALGLVQRGLFVDHDVHRQGGNV